MSQVKVNPTGGPVSLQVKSGPPCLGSFSIFYSNSTTGEVNQLFADSPCSIADALPDSFILPFTAAQLPAITLTICGKYGPLPNKTQVAVRYIFVQDGSELSVNPGNANVIAENVSLTYKEYTHDFTFNQ